MKLLAEKHQSQIQFEMQGTDFTIQGNPFHLTHVVYNLVDNALKYSAVGTNTLVELSTQGKNVRFIVADKNGK